MACQTRTDLKHHFSFLEQFSPRNMSGDESDYYDPLPKAPGPPKRWRIIAAEWHGFEMSEFFRILDVVHRLNWFNPTLNPIPEEITKIGVHTKPGNAPRFRVPSHSKEPGSPVRGLPRNCYNETWLKSLCPWQLEQLQVKDIDYDFYVPPNTYVHNGYSENVFGC